MSYPIPEILRRLNALESQSSGGPVATLPGIAQGAKKTATNITGVGYTTAVQAAHAILVSPGQKVSLSASVEYDAAAGEGTATVEQQIVDNLGTVYDDVFQTVAAQASQVLTRFITVDAAVLAPTMLSFSVQAKKTGAPAVTGNAAAISITAQAALPAIT